MPLNKNRELRDWQQKFIDAYAVSNAQKSLLVAAIGTGKSITALSAARKKIADGAVSNVIVVSDRRVLQEQWRQVGKELDLELAGSLSHLLTSHQQGAVITYQSLNNLNNLDLLKANAKEKSSLFIFDEVYRYLNKAEEISAEVTSLNKESLQKLALIWDTNYQ
ncbi:MAG: DEAD/DEAH box helicase family protein [Nostoc sp.]|uniref:DEAD/DEAH box helicase family protein n=1 Tax=Nostoc sp. TaxID=1180 RepID=UPI002FFB41DD